MTNANLEKAQSLKSQIKAAEKRLTSVNRAGHLKDAGGGSFNIVLAAPDYPDFEKTIFGSRELAMRPLMENFIKTARQILELKIKNLENDFANL